MTFDRTEDYWNDIDADSHDELLQESSACSSFGDTTQSLRPSSSGDSVNSPRHGSDLRKQTDKPFVKGPICRDWIVRASILQKTALRVGLALYFKAGVRKDDFIEEDVRLCQLSTFRFQGMGAGKLVAEVARLCNRAMIAL